MAEMTEDRTRGAVAQLEAENARAARRCHGHSGSRRGPRRGSGAAAPAKRARGRTAAAIVLVVIGLLLAPVAVISGWARLELVDTDRFVATFAPLAEEPGGAGVRRRPGHRRDQGAGRHPAADLRRVRRHQGARPAAACRGRARAARGPATQGLESLVSSVVDRVVESPAFADVWRDGASRHATRRSSPRCRAIPMPRSRSAATAPSRCSSAPSSRR